MPAGSFSSPKQYSWCETNGIFTRDEPEYAIPAANAHPCLRSTHRVNISSPVSYWPIRTPVDISISWQGPFVPQKTSLSPPAHSTISVVITEKCNCGLHSGKQSHLKSDCICAVCIESLYILPPDKCKAMKLSARHRGPYRGWMPLLVH